MSPSVPGCDFTPPVGFLYQTEVIWISCNPGSFQNRIDRRLTLSAGISGAFNALPICDNRAGHLSNGL